MMVRTKMQEKEKYAAKLERFFKEADQDGNGTLDRGEFQAMIDNPDIEGWLTIIGLDQHEVMGLFAILDNGDGMISYQEFVGGCMRLKGSARAIDSVLLLHEQLNIKTMLEELYNNVCKPHQRTASKKVFRRPKLELFETFGSD